MKEIVQFLDQNPVFYLATSDGGVPKVRPFGAKAVFENKLYFCTNNTKKVYRQIKTNPLVEISTADTGGSWIRIWGSAVFDDRREAKEAMLKSNPMLNNLYTLDDGVFSVFYLENAAAVLENMEGLHKEFTF
jgi:uncharacterized pyridoxamine 5'-phosphate oxidase family protein